MKAMLNRLPKESKHGFKDIKSLASSRGNRPSPIQLLLSGGKRLLPPSIQLGPRSVGWVETEINAVNVARILGKTDEEIKSLVMRLVKERVHLAEGAANV